MPGGGSPAERCRKPFPMRLVAGNAEAQAVRASAKGRVRMPALSRRRKPSASWRCGEPKESGSTEDAPAVPTSSASSRAASAPSRARIASVQSRSASALVPIAIAGPLTGQGPSAARKRSADVRRSDGEAEPEAREAKGLAERAQDDRPGFGKNGRETLVAPSKSAKASSTMSSPPRRTRRACRSRRSMRRATRPSGLLGLTTIATSTGPRLRATRPARLARRRRRRPRRGRRRSVPARRRRPFGASRASAWISACEPGPATTASGVAP